MNILLSLSLISIVTVGKHVMCSVTFLISQSTQEAHVKRHYYAVSVVNTCSLAQQVTAIWHIDDVTLTHATTVLLAPNISA